MIKQWVKAGNDWIAVDELDRACYVIKPLDDESIIQRMKVSEIGSQHAREPSPNRVGIPESLKLLELKGGGQRDLNQCMDVITKAFTQAKAR